MLWFTFNFHFSMVLLDDFCRDIQSHTEAGGELVAIYPVESFKYSFLIVFTKTYSAINY